MGLSSPLSIDWDYYPINSDNLLRCIVNSNKPDRKNKQSLVIETTVAFANKHLQDDEANIISLLIPEVRQLLSLDQNKIQYQALHKWRYATPIFKNAANLVCFDRSLGLGVCGDWLEGGGVEGAYLSGVRMAHLLRQIILGTKE